MTTRKSSESDGTVYGLCDPRSGELRYVGQTTKPLSRRLKGHLSCSKRKDQRNQRHVCCWIRSLPEPPDIVELLRCPVDALYEEEQRLVSELKADGARLVNHTDGGSGRRGYKLSAESRRKIGDAQRGRVWTQEQREAQSRALKGKPKSAEMRAKLSKSKIGTKHSEASRAAMRVAWARRKAGSTHA
jgi:hypothetical protein